MIPYKELGLPMDEFWFNIAAHGEFTGWHDHKERSELSGVYYLHVPDNSGDIHFRKKDDDETFEWQMKSQTGKLVLFDSNIEQSLPENKSKENRISIAFNLCSLPLKISLVNSVYLSNKFTLSLVPFLNSSLLITFKYFYHKGVKNETFNLTFFSWSFGYNYHCCFQPIPK